MGVLQTSKNQAIMMLESTNVQDKGNHNGKDPKASDSKLKEIQKCSKGALDSKKRKRFENTKCPYCMRGFHLEN